jgi:AbrB family looped-hinge helix DNA binding protein
MDHHTSLHRVRVDSAGRVLIPAGLRERLGIAPGQELLLLEDSAGLRLRTFAQSLAEAQAALAKYRRPGESVVDELLAERRAEAEREERE